MRIEPQIESLDVFPENLTPLWSTGVIEHSPLAYTPLGIRETYGPNLILTALNKRGRIDIPRATGRPGAVTFSLPLNTGEAIQSRLETLFANGTGLGCSQGRSREWRGMGSQGCTGASTGRGRGSGMELKSIEHVGLEQCA